MLLSELYIFFLHLYTPRSTWQLYGALELSNLSLRNYQFLPLSGALANHSELRTIIPTWARRRESLSTQSDRGQPSPRCSLCLCVFLGPRVYAAAVNRATCVVDERLISTV